MARRYYRSRSYWAPYVPVARRRLQAAHEAQRLAKKGRPLSPVVIDGRAIAGTFWGKAWCDNLESYSDFANRLPRGRTYVRNGSVIDLQMTAGKVTALVSGSRIYTVEVSLRPLAKPRWQAIVGACAGKIDSLVALLQGKLASSVLEVLVRRGTGLFPEPAEIAMKCSCPDWAEMCKHVAAALYGVGARLDDRPELFFLLRQVDQTELLARAGAGGGLATKGSRDRKVLDSGKLSGLFGIELDDGAPAGGDAAPHQNRRKTERPEPTAHRARTAPARHAQPKPASVRKKGRGGAAGRSVTARELLARGIPHSAFQNWLNSGVLLRTPERGVYLTTPATEARIEAYLARETARARTPRRAGGHSR